MLELILWATEQQPPQYSSELKSAPADTTQALTEDYLLILQCGCI